MDCCKLECKISENMCRSIVEGETSFVEIPRLETIAKKGCPRAQYLMGFYLDETVGNKKSKAIALKWYEKSATQGNIDAQYALADGLNMEGLAKKRKGESLRWYAMAALQGDENAEHELFCLMEEGYEFDFDTVKGGEDLKAVAEERILEIRRLNRDLEAVENSGSAEIDFDSSGYIFHHGVKNIKNPEIAIKNLRENLLMNGDKGNTLYYIGQIEEEFLNQKENSLQWYGKAMDYGIPHAAIRMGLLSESGNFQCCDSESYFCKAVEISGSGFDLFHVVDDEIVYKLGVSLLKGKRCSANPEAAYAVLSRTQDIRAKLAITQMKEHGIYLTKDTTQAVVDYKTLSDKMTCDPSPDLRLGRIFERGRGVKTNFSKAKSWYKKAIKKGSEEAKFRLALLYIRGKGLIKKDNTIAARLLKEAARNGHKKSIKLLERHGQFTNV